MDPCQADTSRPTPKPLPPALAPVPEPKFNNRPLTAPLGRFYFIVYLFLPLLNGRRLMAGCLVRQCLTRKGGGGGRHPQGPREEGGRIMEEGTHKAHVSFCADGVAPPAQLHVQWSRHPAILCPFRATMHVSYSNFHSFPLTSPHFPHFPPVSPSSPSPIFSTICAIFPFSPFSQGPFRYWGILDSGTWETWLPPPPPARRATHAGGQKGCSPQTGSCGHAGPLVLAARRCPSSARGCDCTFGGGYLRSAHGMHTLILTIPPLNCLVHGQSYVE